MFKILNLKNFFLATFAFILVFSSVSIPSSAAKFYPVDNQDGDNIQIPSSNENVYAAGNKITVSEQMQKDVVVAGSKITITGTISRSLMAAASEEINVSSNVGGAVRIAANKVTLTGIFNEEVIITASEVEIRDAKISGDLIVSGGKVTIQNSQIFAESKVSYRELNGDLDAQTRGKVEKTKQDFDFAKAFAGFGFWVGLAQQISSLLFLALICFWLYKRNALSSSEIMFNQKFGIDFLIGLGVFVLMIPFLALSFIFQFYFLAITIVGLILLTYALTECVKPIYLANLLKNSLKIELDIKLLIPLVYIGTLILLYIPFLNYLEKAL